jgi:hypothetical protein
MVGDAVAGARRNGMVQDGEVAILYGAGLFVRCDDDDLRVQVVGQ